MLRTCARLDGIGLEQVLWKFTLSLLKMCGPANLVDAAYPSHILMQSSHQVTNTSVSVVPYFTKTLLMCRPT